MKIDKTILVTLSFLIVLVGVELYQYSQTNKIYPISASSTIPNPGHTWSSMECSSDSLCINTTNNYVGIGTDSPSSKLEVGGNIKLSGVSPTYKITNVAAPTSESDVATKQYVDAASSTQYTSCYVVSSTTAGLTCNTGYTAIFWEQNGCWQNSGPYAGTGAGLTLNIGGTLVVQPGWAIDANTVYWGESGGSSNYGGKGAACRTLAGSCYDSYSSRCAPMLILNGNTIAGPIATWPANHSFGLCCQ